MKAAHTKVGLTSESFIPYSNTFVDVTNFVLLFNSVCVFICYSS